MDICEILKYLSKKYPPTIYKGYKFMMREDGDVYIYLRSLDGDGWYVRESYNTLSEFISTIKEK